MSFPPNVPGRGCSSSFPQPVSEDDIGTAQSLNNTIYRYNCVSPPTSSPRLEAIWYRSAMTYDICHHVFRWTTMPYDQVFQNGFQARSQRLENGQRVEDEYYFNLYDHVTNDGRPLAPSSERPRNHAFVSTTLSSNWNPSVNPGQSMRMYRYEIYAPGGIWVTATLGDHYPQRLRSQNEIAFAVGIAPQYVRSAQLFIVESERGSIYSTRRRVNNEIVVNGHFEPQMDSEDVLLIQHPVHDRLENRTRVALTIRIWRPQVNQRRHKREVSTKDAVDWYANEVANVDTYIDAAFRSSRKNEAYIFMGNEYVLLNYAPGTRDDRIVSGPLFICEGYPSLTGTAFGEYGIDCAFACHDSNEAFIFSGNLCARIDYAPRTRDDKILSGPMTIAAMFPFFKDTIFEMGVDAAFEATRRNEAYLFKGSQYALINYNSKSLIAIRTITEGFYSLKNTIFEDGVEAAFASHRTDEAYLFKGDQYALINFAPGTTDVIGGVKGIRLNWPSLGSILPRKNGGLDFYDDGTPSTPAPKAEGHDEL